MLRLVACCIVMVLSLAPPGRSQDEPVEAAVERVRTEAIPKWDDYDRFAATLQGTIRLSGSIKFSNGTEDNSTVERTFRQGAAGCVHSVGESPPPRRGPATRVHGTNSRYSFLLSQSKPDSGWILKELGPPGEVESRHSFSHRSGTTVNLRDGVRCEGAALVHLDALHVRELFRAPHYRVVSAVPATVVGHPPGIRFRIVNTTAGKPTGAYGSVVRETAVTLVPSAYWTIAEIETTVEYTSFTSEGKSTYQVREFDGGYPLPVRCTHIGSTSTSNTALRLDYDLASMVDVPESDFTLSAFGLPEPVGVVWEKPTPRYIWFLVAAGAFVSLAVGFRFLARRRAARVAT